MPEATRHQARQCGTAGRAHCRPTTNVRTDQAPQGRLPATGGETADGCGIRWKQGTGSSCAIQQQTGKVHASIHPMARSPWIDLVLGACELPEGTEVASTADGVGVTFLELAIDFEAYAGVGHTDHSPRRPRSEVHQRQSRREES